MLQVQNKFHPALTELFMKMKYPANLVLHFPHLKPNQIK